MKRRGGGNHKYSKSEDVGGCLIEIAKFPEAIRETKVEPRADGNRALNQNLAYLVMEIYWTDILARMSYKSKTSIHKQNEQRRGPFKTLEDMPLRACAIKFGGKGWVNILPLGRGSHITTFAYHASIKADTHSVTAHLWSELSFTCLLELKLADSSKYLRGNPMENSKWDKVMLKVSHWKRGVVNVLANGGEKLNHRKPLEIVGREAFKRFEESVIPFGQSSMELQRVGPRVSIGIREEPNQKKISTTSSSRPPRRQDAHMRREDKASLTGGIVYNTLCFQGLTCR
ncbi:hypothetical protein Tco_0494552 [Tanacetum coccineum]